VLAAIGTKIAVVIPKYTPKVNISIIVVDTGPEITAEFQLYLKPNKGINVAIKLPKIIATMNETEAIAAINANHCAVSEVKPFNWPNIPQTIQVLAKDKIAIVIPVYIPTLFSFHITCQKSLVVISSLAIASMTTDDDWAPVFPAESLIEDPIDKAVANAMVNIFAIVIPFKNVPLSPPHCPVVIQII
jgi:hypothetical protein